jgi:hypothetical protein
VIVSEYFGDIGSEACGSAGNNGCFHDAILFLFIVAGTPAHYVAFATRMTSADAAAVL